MKTHKVAQAKQSAEPVSAQAEGTGTMQRKVADTPRQMGEAAHIAQLKGDTKPKGKAPPPKKGKGK
jgi:hypothetical protein